VAKSRSLIGSINAVLLQNKEDKNVAVLISLNSRELGYLPHIYMVNHTPDQHIQTEENWIFSEECLHTKSK